METQPVYMEQKLLPVTVGLGFSLFISFLNLPPGDCLPGVKHVHSASKPTSRELLARGTASVYGFLIYLQVIVGQRCCLFIRFSNLPQGTCPFVVQPV